MHLNDIVTQVIAGAVTGPATDCGAATAKPGMRIRPIGLIPEAGDAIAGRKYAGLLVELPELGWHETERCYPQAILPMLLYSSQEIRGQRMWWLQWPVKYWYLATTHSLSGRAYRWLMLSWEFFWCHVTLMCETGGGRSAAGRRVYCVPP